MAGKLISDLDPIASIIDTTLLETEDTSVSYKATFLQVFNYINSKSTLMNSIYLPRGYIDGLICSNATETDHDIEIAPGKARDSTDAITLVLLSPIIKQIDNGWAAGTNAGGMDTGAVAANTTYYVWLIRKDSDGSIDALFSLSSTAPTMPAGYTYKRMIRRQVTDAAANIRPTDQVGDIVTLITPYLDRASSTYGTTDAIAPSSIAPPKVRAMLNIETEVGTSTTYLWCRAVGQTNNSPDANTSDTSLSAVSTRSSRERIIKLSSLQQFITRSSSSDATLKITTLGWIDDRGRNA